MQRLWQTGALRSRPFFGLVIMSRSGFLALALLAAVAVARADSFDDEVTLCSACHGEEGKPIDGATPIIWGQNAGYLYLQLRDFQKGARKDDRMSPVVETLPKDDLLKLAEYFSQKPWPNLAQPSASKADQATAVRANSSIGCTGCHRDDYVGDASVPRTADQQHDYLLKTMMDFRSHARANNPGMTDLMIAATPDELAAMANYLAGL